MDSKKLKEIKKEFFEKWTTVDSLGVTHFMSYMEGSVVVSPEAVWKFFAKHLRRRYNKLTKCHKCEKGYRSEHMVLTHGNWICPNCISALLDQIEEGAYIAGWADGYENNKELIKEIKSSNKSHGH